MLSRQKKPKQKPKQQPLSREIEAEILHRWRFSKSNAITDIASDYNITVYSIHKIINNFLSSKTPQ